MPLSYRTRGASAKAENTVGMPITTPEKVESPPKMFSIVVGRRDNDKERQLGDDETQPRDSSVDRTWRSRLLMITIVSDEIFGSLSSSGLIKVPSVFDSRGTLFSACNGSIGTSRESGEALETGW